MVAKRTNDALPKEKRLGKVSSKRQLTIPKEFYDRLNIVKDVEMVMEGNALIIKPLTSPVENDFDDFSDLILKSIVEETFINRNDMLTEFRKRKEAFRLGGKALVEDMIDKSKKDTRTSEEIEKNLFGDIHDV
jgi:virulence-associated protein VagC